MRFNSLYQLLALKRDRLPLLEMPPACLMMRDLFIYFLWWVKGAELPAPLINDKVLEYNFTNEGGVNGTSRFLKNVMGLWLVQECRRTWERRGKVYSYDELTRLAESATPFVSLVNLDDAS